MDPKLENLTAGLGGLLGQIKNQQHSWKTQLSLPGGFEDVERSLVSKIKMAFIMQAILTETTLWQIEETSKKIVDAGEIDNLLVGLGKLGGKHIYNYSDLFQKFDLIVFDNSAVILTFYTDGRFYLRSTVLSFDKSRLEKIKQTLPEAYNYGEEDINRSEFE